MGWRDRAEPVTVQDSTSTGGGWRSRAIAVDAKSSKTYGQDVASNAMQGLREIPGAVMGIADTAAKVANLTNPVELARSLASAIVKPGETTPIMEDAQAAMNAIQGVKSGIVDTVKDIGSAAIAPVDMVLNGTPLSETNIGKRFRERPLGVAFNVATAPIAAAKLAKVTKGLNLSKFAKVSKAAKTGEEAAAAIGADAASVDLPSFLEAKGAKGLNAIAGIRANTIAAMAGPGENPGVVGTKLARTLSDEGAIGANATETFQRSNKLATQYGKAVDQALTKIKETNKSLGVYPELADPLKIPATPALKPIIDRANELSKSGYPADRAAARYWRAAYNALSEKTNEAGGFLTLDQVRDELQKVGQLYERGGIQNAGIVDEVYGHLANLRDSMVDEIASTVGDPTLAENLVKANAGYSRYMRILPDIKRAAAAESVGQLSLGEISRELKTAIINRPSVARGIMNTGSKTSSFLSRFTKKGN